MTMYSRFLWYENTKRLGSVLLEEKAFQSGVIVDMCDCAPDPVYRARSTSGETLQESGFGRGICICLQRRRGCIQQREVFARDGESLAIRR